MLCTTNGLFGEERGQYLFVANMGSLEKNIIACCLRLGKDTKTLNQHRAEIRAKLESAKDVTELEALLSTERYANMLQNNTCQEADDAKEDKFYIVRNTDNLSSLEYMKDEFKITLAWVSKRSKNHYRIFYTKLLNAIITRDFVNAFIKKYDLHLNTEDYLHLFGFCLTGLTLKVKKLEK